MSSNTYRARFREATAAHVAAAQSADHWRTVADNRFDAIKSVDTALAACMDRLTDLGSIFGATAHEGKVPLASSQASSSEEALALISFKIKSIMYFIRHLAAEALSAQRTMDDVLELSSHALTVIAPVTDSSAAGHSIQMEDILEPFDNFIEREMDIDETDSEGTNESSEGAEKPDPNETALVIARDRSLF